MSTASDPSAKAGGRNYAIVTFASPPRCIFKSAALLYFGIGFHWVTWTSFGITTVAFIASRVLQRGDARQ